MTPNAQGESAVTGIRTLHPVLRAALLGCAALALLAPGAALAQADKAKSTQTEARWVSFDAAAKTVVLKIQKPGKGPNKSLLKKNKEETFRVVPEGSVLKRTSVAINGQKGEITDIPAGKQVNVYWVPDPENEGGFFARKIDVVLSEEELDKRWATEE
jgi:hypothetical protein